MEKSSAINLWIGIGCFSRILSGGQKVFYIKKKKNYLPNLSHDARNPFQQMSLITFSYIKDLKPVAVTYAFLCQIL